MRIEEVEGAKWWMNTRRRAREGHFVGGLRFHEDGCKSVNCVAGQFPDVEANGFRHRGTVLATADINNRISCLPLTPYAARIEWESGTGYNQIE